MQSDGKQPQTLAAGEPACDGIGSSRRDATDFVRESPIGCPTPLHPRLVFSGFSRLSPYVRKSRLRAHPLLSPSELATMILLMSFRSVEAMFGPSGWIGRSGSLQGSGW